MSFTSYASLLTLSVALAADPGLSPDEALLQQAGYETAYPSLLRILTQRTPKTSDLQQIPRLIRQLASDTFEDRADASKRLINLGHAAADELRRAVASPDIDLARRSALCLKTIDQTLNLAIPLATIRLLARYKTSQAAATILAYHATVHDEESEHTILSTLESIGIETDDLRHLFLRALQDPSPHWRAAAAFLLGKHDIQNRPSVRKLLADPDGRVRLRAAQGLLAGKDASGIRTLIDLLQVSDLELGWQAEELLHWFAEPTAPTQVLGRGSPELRAACREAWLHWWRQYGSKRNWIQPNPRKLKPGLVLLCEMEMLQSRPGRILLVGCDGKVRWQLRDLRDPVDVQLLPGNRILLAEGHPANRVTVRSLQGNLISQLVFDDDLVATQQLRNANTFVATRRTLQEFAPDGSETYCYRIGIHWGAQRLDNAQIICVVETGGRSYSIKQFDIRTGTEVMGRQLERPPRFRCQTQLLPDGGVLLGSFTDSCKVSREGRRVWRPESPGVGSVTGLQGGNLLLTGAWHEGGYLLELASAGQTVGKTTWKASLNTVVTRVHICLASVRVGFEDQRPAKHSSIQQQPGF